MRIFIYPVVLCILITLMGCQKDIPEPETKITLQSLSYTSLSSDIPVSGIEHQQTEPFYVKHHVKGKEVLIECIVQGITFRETNANNKGKILLYVDGKKREEISSAAFIVKGLPSGTHRLKLEVIKENNGSLHLQKEFNITIP